MLQVIVLQYFSCCQLKPFPHSVTMTPCDTPSPRANGCVVAHPTKDEVLFPSAASIIRALSLL